MSKLTLATAALCLSSLVGCIPPEPPPARFRPNPPYPPTPMVDAYGQPIDPAPPVNPEPPADPAPTPPAAGGYPTATKTANPNQVLSPYEPFNVIDVEGFKTGQLARDPSNQKIFRIP
ncbi:MAG: hypothetical protein ABIT37_21530 [Luteolibacter sp.]